MLAHQKFLSKNKDEKIDPYSLIGIDINRQNLEVAKSRLGQIPNKRFCASHDKLITLEAHELPPLKYLLPTALTKSLRYQDEISGLAPKK